MIKKLLVIDDEKSITTIIDKIASALGYEVLSLNDPSKALRTLALFQPDIIMLDIVMPNLDGIDILPAALAAGTGVRVIMMTGFGGGYLRLGQAVAAFYHHPSVATLAKPFRRADVVALFDGELKGRPAVPIEATPAATFFVTNQSWKGAVIR